MTYNITQRHIDKGIKGDCRFCAAALAISEVHPNAVVAVRYIQTEIDDVIYKNPPILRDFIASLDEGEPVQPITFDLKG